MIIRTASILMKCEIALSKSMLMMPPIFLIIQALLSVCLLQIVEVSSVEQILTKPISLIYFFAPDCQFCHAFLEDYEYLSLIYNENSRFQVVGINGREHEDLKNMFGVTHFPTIKLYNDEKKQVVTFKEARLVENVLNFVKRYANIEPRTGETKNRIARVFNIADIEELKHSMDAVLIAFVNKGDRNWVKLHYPSHFYQELARTFDNVKFAIKYFEDAESDLMQKYHVSNVPALILLEGNHIGAFNSLSTNPMRNYKIDAHDIKQFLDKFRSRSEGIWFEDLDSLALYAENARFTGHMERKAGMNYIEGNTRDDMSGLKLEEQYLILVDKIEF